MSRTERPSAARAPERADAAGEGAGRGASAASARRRIDAALRWGGIALVVVLAALTARRMQVRAVVAALGRADALLLTLATLGCVLSLAFQAARWLALVRPVDRGARGTDAFFALVAGYAAGLVLPARASDLVRGHLMATRTGGSTASLTAAAVVDHLLASAALFAVLGVGAASSTLPAWLRHTGGLAALGALAGFLALWIVRPRGGIPRPRGGLRGLLDRLRAGLVAVDDLGALARSLFWALAGWATEVVVAHLTLSAFGLPAAAGPSALVVVATTLSAAISISPGNAGPFEVAAVLALSGLGVSREAGLAFAIAYHAIHLAPVALIGGGWLVLRGGKPRELARREPERA